MQDSATAYLPPHLIYNKQALLCSMPLALHMLYVTKLFTQPTKVAALHLGFSYLLTIRANSLLLLWGF